LRWASLGALALACLLLASALRSLPLRNEVRRALVRGVGEVAALALRIRDPWAHQPRAFVMGLPDSAFLATSFPDTSWHAQDPRGLRTRVAGWSSTALSAEPGFDFERWDDPGIADLRRRYRLDTLVSHETPDFKSLERISAWVASRWEPGTSTPPLATHFDAREILRRAAAGEEFDCGTYGWTLIQVLAAAGVNGRLVELEGPDGQGHSTVEAWCDELGKWVVLDPYWNVVYVRDGVPQNALELHRAWLSGRWRDVVAVEPANMWRPSDWRAIPLEQRLSAYAHFDVRMRNNLMSARYPRWHPKANRIMGASEWAGDGAGRPFFRNQERDSSRLYFGLKTTDLRWSWLSPEPGDPPRLLVRLATRSANFDSFVRSEGSGWVRVGATDTLAVEAGTDTVWYASRNRAHRVGRHAWIAFQREAPPAPAAGLQIEAPPAATAGEASPAPAAGLHRGAP